MLRGIEPGGDLGGVGLRGGARGPQNFNRDRDSLPLMRDIDRRGAGDRRKIDDAGHRALEGLTAADPHNLRLNHDANSGALSIDRQAVDDRGNATWRRVWDGEVPRANHADPSAAWSVMTRDAGNRLAEDYRERPYNNRAPLHDNAFPDAARGAIQPTEPTREHPGRVRKPSDWGLPRDQRRT
ncbi:MAG TPA: hypothetical protein VLC93_14570 [Myxococcota bacterium]|nr:hypothetical protein [Myxococcota bacterium]